MSNETAEATCNLCGVVVKFELPMPFEEVNNVASEHIKKCSGVGSQLSVVFNPLAFFTTNDQEDDEEIKPNILLVSKKEHAEILKASTEKESFDIERTPLFRKDKKYEPTYSDGSKYECACCLNEHIFSYRYSLNIEDELRKFMGKRAEVDRYKVRKFKITIEEL